MGMTLALQKHGYLSYRNLPARDKVSKKALGHGHKNKSIEEWIEGCSRPWSRCSFFQLEVME
jgi:hypothetical protein